MSKAFRTPYPDYDVLSKWSTPSWNEPTRKAVDQRLHKVPPRRFLGVAEYAVLEAVCARIIPQPDRADPVPIAPWIDDKLVHERKDGYRRAKMPPLRTAWMKGLRAVDAEARLRHGIGFSALASELQDEVLKSVSEGDVKAPEWEGLQAKVFFKQYLVESSVAVYYAHPAAWNEMGYGGPASPRGYVRLVPNRRDPWEAEERHD